MPSPSPRINAEIAGLLTVSTRISLTILLSTPLISVVLPGPDMVMVAVPLPFPIEAETRSRRSTLMRASTIAVTNAAISIKGYKAPIKPSYAMPSESRTDMPAAKVDAETAPNSPAVAMPSTFDTPRHLAKVPEPIRTIAMPTTIAAMPGTSNEIKSASRIDMPAPRPTFISSRITINL